jgi:hypothetical protein
MIYQKFNFMDSYSNASGNRRDSMVLSQLGNVITAEPKAVKHALEDAGVKVAKNPTRRDLVRAIVANKTNKKMVQNLSVLITASSTKAPYYNVGEGEEEDTQDDYLKPLSVKGTKLTSTTKPTELAKGTKSKVDGGWLKQIGSFFQRRKTEKQLGGSTKKSTSEESAFKRFADWFTKNRGTINDVGQTLYNSLDKGNQIPTGDGNSNEYLNGKQPMPNRNKAIIAIGVIAVVGLAYYFLVGKGKGKGKGK